MTIDYGDPYWTAPLVGQDWRDEDVLRATGWLRTFVPAQAFERRLDQARETLLTAPATWETGDDTTLFNPADAIAWYVLQAETFAIDRRLLVPEWTVRRPAYVQAGRILFRAERNDFPHLGMNVREIRMIHENAGNPAIERLSTRT